MKVTEKPVRTSVGLFFIGLALVAAISILPGARGSQSPFLYVCILGGLFVGIPAALGIDSRSPYNFLKGEQTVSLTFTGLRQLRLADLDPGKSCLLTISSVAQDQMDRIRYRVFNIEQDLTLAFYCVDFVFSA